MYYNIEKSQTNRMIPTDIIVSMALKEFIKSGAGEIAKKSLTGTVQLSRKLHEKIANRFKGRPEAENALTKAERSGEISSFKEVIKYLDVEMKQDQAFAEGLQQLAQKIIDYQTKSRVLLNQSNMNFGRDQNIVNQPQGDIRIGGS